MGKRRRSPRKLFPDGTVKRGRPSPGSLSDGSADEATMRCEPVAMGSLSPLSSAAVSAFVMVHARDTLAQGFHLPTPGSPLDETTMRELVKMHARDILAREFHGLAYIDCVAIDVAVGEKAGPIKLIIE